MNKETTIIIGCDQTEILTDIVGLIKKIPDFLVNIITVSRISDLLNISKSIHPALLVFNFRSNQIAINNFNQFVNKPETPILCITKNFDSDFDSLNSKNIIFTFPIENMTNKTHFTSLIHSIFLLKNQTVHSNTKSLASQTIEKDLLNSDRNMSRYVLELDQKIEVLHTVKERIKTLCPTVDTTTRLELLSIVNAIKTSAYDTKLWDDFKLYFEKTNPNFLFVLAERHPKLTTKDLKYCCYLKMNMSNDDIRSLLGINQESVRTHKYRLKKKMRLQKDLDLYTYLKAI
ncbi:hypothetical protein FIA58_004530 [Flavobacterium jejuense]|uniref:HTH luxR-type domain-containing protein n=1 Tax=Flavobacterium jejuense TaxID=1544455 RepID=A0ABX0IMB7_9FLAO|nr:hypothetical protein [Flavobacterium jejuense]NHN24937.1 hypothetical protein [Flavobacterium jejuense]